ncbi:DUF5677 domain-containing protein [Terribacillus sp. JSM ZJ617]|uniref:DUF5677 domain-containing protein n=1 Tax=Terribacillus sp. JSM ZJ617 TaxID=3342119 RepID=UPI0035A885C1
MLNFFEQQEKSNLIPLEINKKDEYYSDLFELNNCFVSRIDVFQIANSFLMESVQLISNAITLFEMGYFDSAYYTLRQSLEVALTMVYLSEQDNTRRDKELLKWKNKSSFPMYKKMADFLEKHKKLFLDVKEKMSDFFNEINETKKRLNKYVHKQGFDTFYVSRNHILNRGRDQTTVIKEFESFLEQCIGAIAVFRLCIDPIPILLRDEEIYSRTETLMSDALSIEFIERYIGIQNIENYKQTIIYKDAYDSFIQLDKRLPAQLEVTKNRYIDRHKINEILSQFTLLRKLELQAIVITMMSEKVTTITLFDFPIEFFTTNTKSARAGFGYAPEIYLKLRDKNSPIVNFSIEGVFLSKINVGSDDFLLEHNIEFNLKEFEEFQINAKNKFDESFLLYELEK